MHTIEHGDYRLVCDPGNGGTISSLAWRGKHLLRPVHKREVSPLGTACFPLVPFSNRIAGPLPTEGGEIDLLQEMAGEPLAIHGLGWTRAWNVVQSSSNAVTLEFAYDGPHWPSAFRSRQLIELGDAGLSITLDVTNTGTDVLPVGLGLHPYFPKGDCRLSIAAGSLWHKDARGLPLEMDAEHPLSPATVTMTDISLDHSFSGWDGEAEMVWPSQELRVILSASKELRELVVYSPQEDLFCIEPVSHLTNAAVAHQPELQAGWRQLAPGDTFAGTMKLEASDLTK